MPTTKYTREALTVAAAFATTMTEMMQNLGEEVTPGKRANLWAKVGYFNIDTSHFERSPHGATNMRYRQADVERAVARSQSVSEVMRTLGIKPAGGSHYYLSRRIREAGLDTSHFLGQGHLRGKPGRRLPPHQVLTLRPEGSPRAKAPQLTRAMVESGVPHECSSCGIGPLWRGGPLTLAVDHINGNAHDNRLANLRFLCPNCHAQTSTWCRRKGP